MQQSLPAEGRTDRAAFPRARALLWAEFLTLYVGLPAALYFLLPSSAMWPVMFGSAALAWFLLRRDPDFAWRDRFGLPTARQWAWALAVGLLALAIGWLTVAALAPGAEFALLRRWPERWALVMVLYPILSAFPQEVIFRTLFFTRYRRLFPSVWSAVTANAVLFGLAHAFLQNWVAVGLSGLGGALFALAYLQAGPRRGLLYATALHGVAGCALFTAGMGVFLFHGFAAP